MIKEFKEFISRGNVIDLAIAVILGAAFTAIISSFVDDLLMPLIGIFIGGVDFSTLSITVGGAVLAYGKFIMAVIYFLIVAFVLFLIIRVVNKSKQDQDEGPTEIELLTEIRDALKKK